MKLHQLFCILPLLPLFPLLGCSGGGSEPDTGPPEADTSAPVLFLDGDAFAETGHPYQARVMLGMSSQPQQPGSVQALAGMSAKPTYQLLEGPDGLGLDPLSGLITWVPSPTQVGIQQLRIQATLQNEMFEESLQIPVQGMSLAGSAFVDSRLGGVVIADATGSAIQGSRIIIPPGAMAADAEVEILAITHAATLPKTALGIEINPSQQFSAPVTVELHYTDSWLAALGVTSESNIALFHQDEATGQWFMLPTTVDAQANTLRAQTTHFSSFAAFWKDIGQTIDGATQELGELLNQILGDMDTAIQSPEQFFWLWPLLNQPRELVVVKGNGFRRDQKNALLVHGLLSKDSNFPQLKAWAETHYDNVIFYNYPSGKSIRSNAAWLANELTIRALTDADQQGLFACIDVYGHSMGGLVSRAAVEDYNLPQCRALTPFVNVTTLGTPHLGGNFLELAHLLEAAMQAPIVDGIRDMVPGSPFLQFLNSGLGRGWIKYHAIAGNLAFNNDGAVSVASAIPANILSPTSQAIFDGQGHSDLHENIMTNGVGLHIQQHVRPARCAPEMLRFGGESFALAYDGSDAVIQATAQLRRDPDFFLPPAFGICAVWEPISYEGWCRDVRVIKSLSYIDGEAFPHLASAREQLLDMGAINVPQAESDWFLEQPGQTFMFHRIENDLGSCFSMHPPQYQLWFRVGGIDEPIFQIGPF